MMPMPLANLTMTDLAAQYWPVALLSFLAAVVFTPACRAVARRKHLVDKPDDFLKPHEKPTALLGGIAIFLGWGAGLVIALLDADAPDSRLLSFLIAGAAITVLGAFDDVKFLKPRTKLAGNLIIAAFVLLAGLGDDIIRVATDLMQVRFETPADRVLMRIYSIPIALFLIVGACNATNLIDGIDGLCSGVLGIISVGFLLLAAHLAITNPDQTVDPHDHERIVLALAMLGAAVGFLPYNLNPATIFMGDAGSMLLGLNAAMIILLFAEAHIILWMIGALMVFGLPIGDMLLTLVRRWRNARPLMAGDRSHFYDQLLDRGLSVRQVVASSYALAILFVAVGCSVIFLRTRHAVLVYFAAAVAGILVIGKLDMVRLEKPSAPDDNS